MGVMIQTSPGRGSLLPPGRKPRLITKSTLYGNGRHVLRGSTGVWASYRLLGHFCQAQVVSSGACRRPGQERQVSDGGVNLETGDRLWLARSEKETLDEYSVPQLVSRQRKRIERHVSNVEPFRLSIEQWAPQCKIVYDKFHIMQHANDAIDEVRKGNSSARAEEAGTHQREEVVLMSR